MAASGDARREFITVSGVNCAVVSLGSVNVFAIFIQGRGDWCYSAVINSDCFDSIFVFRGRRIYLFPIRYYLGVNPFRTTWVLVKDEYICRIVRGLFVLYVGLVRVGEFSSMFPGFFCGDRQAGHRVLVGPRQWDYFLRRGWDRFY